MDKQEIIEVYKLHWWDCFSSFLISLIIVPLIALGAANIISSHYGNNSQAISVAAVWISIVLIASILLYNIWRYKTTNLYVGSSFAVVERRIIQKNLDLVPFRNIESIDYVGSFSQRFFKSGNLLINMHDRTTLLVRGFVSPLLIHEKIMDLRFRQRHGL